MEEIKRKVTKRTKRNVVSRLVHARDDKDTIAAWKLDLNRILHVFNVRSVIFTQLSLTIPFQTELAMNTHMTVSEMHHNVSWIRSDVSRIREEIGGNIRAVSVLRAQSIENGKMFTITQAQTRLGALTTEKARTSHLHLVHLENHLPHNREPVSVAMN